MREALKAFAAIVLATGLAGAGPSVTVPLSSEAGLSPVTLRKMVETQGGVFLRGLDKISAKVTEIAAPLDVPVTYGNLRITARNCNKRPPEETPEQSVFLEVDEMATGQPHKRLFTGWMFWSSPALSALEHPTYDIWLIDCIARAPSQTMGSE